MSESVEKISALKGSTSVSGISSFLGNGDTCRFEPQVDIYKKIFAPPDKTPETLKEYFHKLCVSLNSSAFPTDFQKPKYKAYKDSIDYLIAMADENGRGRKSKQ